MSEETKQTIKELNDSLRTTIIKVAQETERLKIIHSDIIEIKMVVKSGFKESNSRLKKLENWRSYMLGGLTVIVISLPILIKALFL